MDPNPSIRTHGWVGGDGAAKKEKEKKRTHPRSCMKLQIGHATSLCFWKESGMTGCFEMTLISFLFFLDGLLSLSLSLSLSQ